MGKPLDIMLWNKSSLVKEPQESGLPSNWVPWPAGLVPSPRINKHTFVVLECLSCHPFKLHSCMTPGAFNHWGLTLLGQDLVWNYFWPPSLPLCYCS